MKTFAVLTVLGPDRPGIVEALADKIRMQGGSWNESRLAHLQDQFAGIIEISLPEESLGDFRAALADLEKELGLQCAMNRVKEPAPGGKNVKLECLGQDRPGIVFAITDVLHDLDINVESLDTTLQSAPMSGEILFRAEMRVGLPENPDMELLESRLASIGQELMLDVQIEE